MAIRVLISEWRRWFGPVAVILAGFLLRAAYYSESYWQPDEAITVEVVGHMRNSGDWDTNWAKTPTLESGLRYDQYNFSSHLYATYFFYRAVKWVPGLEAWRSRDNGYWVYRFLTVLLASAAVVQTWALARSTAGESAGWAAGALFAVVPLLVQDAHYIRPEAFVTVLTLAAVALSRPGVGFRAGRVLGAAFVLGLLVACKFSMLALTWLPLVPAVADGGGVGRGAVVGRVAVAGGLTLAGLAMGFFVGAPGAVLHPGAFWHGVQHLMAQYAGLHPPHSHLEGGPVADMLGGYFLATLGAPALAAGVAGAGWLAWRREWARLALLAGPLVLFAGYFCTRSVFFERNLSHVVPLFCVLAGAGVVAVARGLAGRWSVRVTAVTLGLTALVVIRPADVSWRLVFTEFCGRSAREHDVLESALRAAHPDKPWWTEEILDGKPLDRIAAHFTKGGGPIVLRVMDYRDEWSARSRAEIPVRFNVEQIGERTSTFADIPACTLHTYNSCSDSYYVVHGLRKQ